MSGDLLGYYSAEYTALTRLAAEFAQAHPQAAARLRLLRDQIDDPHVERLLQGVAFMGARVQQRLDDEFPELTDALLAALYPHYLSPFPSCMMVQLTPKSGLQSAQTVPRGTLVETDPIDGTVCRFRTTAPLTLWPIRIDTVQLSGLPLRAPANPHARNAAGVLRIALRCTAPDMTFEKLGLDHLRLYLRGGTTTAQALHELICAHAISIAFADGVNDPTPIIRGPEGITPGGFTEDEALLPWPPQGFVGFRLLSEYFAFPEKFLFVELSGLTAKTLARAGNVMEIFIYLDRVPPDLERAVDTDSIGLGAVPLINLFEQRCEPIDLDWTQTEYRVDPDLNRPTGMEVWSVQKVSETRPDGTQRPWRPFFRLVHADPDAGKDGGFYLPQRRPAAGGQPGSDVVLMIDDPGFNPSQDVPTRLSIDTLCTNRELPRQLPLRAGDPSLNLGEAAAVVDSIAILTAATAPLRPKPRGQRFWRLVSQLSLSHLTLVGGPDGASALREVLRLHDLRDNTETRAAISALLDVAAKPSVARLPGARAGSFCRGLDVSLIFDPQAWQTGGPYLLASVLERFLALHASVNGFTRTSATLRGQPDPITIWPARAGTRVLL